MNFLYFYGLFWVGFVIVVYAYNKYKLYTSEKWKVLISLFIGLNALFTALVLFNQNTIHQEDISNKISDTYEKLSSELYSQPLTLAMNTPNLRHLINDMFMSDRMENDKLYYDNNNNFDKVNYYSDISSLNPEEKGLFLLICQIISVYSQYYYIHLDLPEYKKLIKSQNNRFLNILSSYLKYKPFRDTVQYFVDFQAGHRSQKFLKEFFNITNQNPSDKVEQLISENKIIDGKINGVTAVDI